MKPSLIFVATVYGQLGYVDAKLFNNPKRNIFILHNKLGEKIKVNSNSDQYEMVHRGNVTDEYELFGDFILVYTETHKHWEAYRRNSTFPPAFISNSPTKENLKLRVANR